MIWIIFFLTFVFGACIGSFLNVLIWRLPREQKINGRSSCPHCRHQLTVTDLVPLLSFAVSRGRCRYCQQKISLRYPIIEAITGLLFVAVTYQLLPLALGASNHFQAALVAIILLKGFLVVSVCVTIFVIDLEHYLILNKIVYGAGLLFVLLLTLQAIIVHSTSPLLSNVVAAALATVPFWLLWKFSDGKWMGFGDVRFVALMGLMLGWPKILVAVLAAFLLGAVVGLGLILSGHKQLSSKIPFGTFLSVATLMAWFFGLYLWRAYWGIVGLH